MAAEMFSKRGDRAGGDVPFAFRCQRDRVFGEEAVADPETAADHEERHGARSQSGMLDQKMSEARPRVRRRDPGSRSGRHWRLSKRLTASAVSDQESATMAENWPAKKTDV